MTARLKRKEGLRLLKDRDRGCGAVAWRQQADSWPGIFTVFDLHEMDVPLFWKELTRVTNLGSRWSGCG
eukprot:1153614-Pelagomonas_calceolata.AAC.2